MDELDETRQSEPKETIDASSLDPHRTRLPQAVPGYRIVRVLGEGGGGVVVEAEQQSPRRSVAIKMLRSAFAGEQAQAMFQREVQTLARLKHPNIAAVHAAGTTVDGQPFLAMELVHGKTLNRYLGKRPPLDRDELRFRLRLVRKIAAAVHYAHQRGVIHRDLKPRNVMVDAELTDAEGIPEIKVLDFGLARLTDEQPGDDTPATEHGVVKGTLAYMSPEQARGNPEEIDTRVDVYALGVILYEALTGERPHDLETQSFVEAVRMIVERPIRPLRTVWPRARVRLDSDLETLVETALAFEADRRYAGANALALDIDRFLGLQPIAARPPGTLYQLRKFAQRNRVLVGGIVATALVLVAGVVTSTLLALEQARQRRNAEEIATFQAEIVSDLDAEQAGVDLLDAIKAQLLAEEGEPLSPEVRAEREALYDRFARIVNSTDLAREMIDRTLLAPAATAAERQFGDQPLVEARLQSTIGESYLGLNLLDDAERVLRRSADLQEAHRGPDSVGALEARVDVATVHSEAGDDDVAEAEIDTLLRATERALGASHIVSLRVRYLRAANLYRMGRIQEALEALEPLVPELEVDARPQAKNLWIQATDLRAAGLMRQGDYESARALYERIIEQLGPAPDDPGLLAIAKSNLAVVQMRLRELESAERLLLEVLEDRKHRLGEKHGLTLGTIGNLAVLYQRQRRMDEAVRIARRVLQLRRERFGSTHDSTLRAMNNLAGMLTGVGSYDEADAILRELLALDESVHPGTSAHGIHLHTFAELWLAQGRWTEADRYLARAIRIYRNTGEAYLGLALVQNAGANAQLGRKSAALNMLEEAIDSGYTRGIDGNERLAPLAGDARFEELLAGVREAAGSSL
jgi:serine/threonine protein kinase